MIDDLSTLERTIELHACAVLVAAGHTVSEAVDLIEHVHQALDRRNERRQAETRDRLGKLERTAASRGSPP